MHSIFHLTAIITSLLSFPSKVTADCCRAASNGYYSDGTSAITYRGVGSCNLFGCNCDGGCRQLNQYGCIDAADDAYYDRLNGDPSNLSTALQIFEDAKSFFNTLRFMSEIKAKPKREFRPRGAMERRQSDDDDDSSPCDQAFNDALQVYATQCPGGTQLSEVVDPQSREPCTGISASRLRVRGTVDSRSESENQTENEDTVASPVESTTQPDQNNLSHNDDNDDEKILHSIVDRDKDGVLDLAEFLAWANYSTGNTLTDYAKIKPWIRLFFAYDEDGDARINGSEVGRPGSRVTWIG